MLQAAVRDRLAKKLVSKKAVVNPKEWISAAFEAGTATAALDLLLEEAVPPASQGSRTAVGLASALTWPLGWQFVIVTL